MQHVVSTVDGKSTREDGASSANRLGRVTSPKLCNALGHCVDMNDLYYDYNTFVIDDNVKLTDRINPREKQLDPQNTLYLNSSVQQS